MARSVDGRWSPALSRVEGVVGGLLALGSRFLVLRFCGSAVLRSVVVGRWSVVDQVPGQKIDQRDVDQAEQRLGDIDRRERVAEEAQVRCEKQRIEWSARPEVALVPVEAMAMSQPAGRREILALVGDQAGARDVAP